ncbi:peroxide stress protein YaaA [Sneathiella glossodoripedis]|uniref:peroxide stress protein YaaA n=1 Tax=Sneathiella glossodoripedis TaxID=418853 RepID=UPI000471E88B|nr:peroxide stress protein YaaA [Sneathiella glossodoripedis]
MLALLSPAKKLNFDRENLPKEHSDLQFTSDTKELLKAAKTQKPDDLKRLMKISDDLSELNFQRFKEMKFPFTPENAKQAAYAFNGDTYAGLEINTLDEKAVKFAQEHVRILSGLYGLIRPLDLIQPYRLEMGTRMPNSRGENLYSFWGDKLAKALNAELERHKNPIVVNLASTEYFKAIPKKALKYPVVTPIFKEVKNGTAKVIGFSAKRARGMMARFISENEIDSPEGLKDFNLAGYKLIKELSNETELQFHRVIS